MDWSGMNQKIGRKKIEGIRFISTFEISDYNNRNTWSFVILVLADPRFHFIFEIMIPFQFTDACEKMYGKSIDRGWSGYLFPVLNWIKFFHAVRRCESHIRPNRVEKKNCCGKLYCADKYSSGVSNAKRYQ